MPGERDKCSDHTMVLVALAARCTDGVLGEREEDNDGEEDDKGEEEDGEDDDDREDDDDG